MLISHVTTTIRTNQRSLYSGMAVSSLREHARPEVTKSSPFAKLNVLPRSFVNASTEDLYNGINKASIGDVQQNSICMHASRVDVPRTKSRQEFASSLGVVPAPSATQTLRPHTAGVARSNARTGHIIKEFFTCDKSRIEPSDHNKIAGKIWIMSELERGQGMFGACPRRLPVLQAVFLTFLCSLPLPNR